MGNPNTFAQFNEWKKIEFDEKIKGLISQNNNPATWTLKNHIFFDFDFKETVLTLLLCVHTTIPKQFKLAKPILSMVLNLCLV